MCLVYYYVNRQLPKVRSKYRRSSCARVYVHTQEAAKVYTQLHTKYLTASKNRVLGSKMERKEVFLTKDRVTWVSNKTAVDFNAPRCYACGPRNLTVPRPGGEDGRGQTQVLPLEPQLEQLQRPSVATCSSSASLRHTAPCSPHCEKDLFALGETSVQTYQSNINRLFPPLFFSPLKQTIIFKRNYFRRSITTSSKITF